MAIVSNPFIHLWRVRLTGYTALEAEPRASVNDKVYEEIAREATARSLLELRNGGKVRPALSKLHICLQRTT